MGTDRDEIEYGPCPCGKGLIRVYYCSPDHPWGGTAWYEGRIDCSACVETFEIIENDNRQLRLARKSDLAKKQRLVCLWHEKCQEMEASADFDKLRSVVEARLSACPSMAARHRFLVHAGLSGSSLASYRRNPSYRLTASNASQVARALQIETPSLHKMAADLERRWRASKIAVPTVNTGLKRLDE